MCRAALLPLWSKDVVGQAAVVVSLGLVFGEGDVGQGLIGRDGGGGLSSCSPLTPADAPSMDAIASGSPSMVQPQLGK